MTEFLVKLTWKPGPGDGYEVKTVKAARFETNHGVLIFSDKDMNEFLAFARGSWMSVERKP